MSNLNVPAGEATSFVGRVRELEDARKLLSLSRLVTLVGVGGVGKTWLARRMATRAASAFPSGVWVVDFTEVSATASSQQVEQSIASALGLHDFSTRRPLDSIIDYLLDQQLLLVLDNCEHVAYVVGKLATDLLSAVPRLHVLATSRHVLGCPGEQVVHVPPLTVSTRPSSSGGEALELLRQRGEVLGVHLTGEELPAATELCRQLDGLPLAIELAAARLPVLSAAEILQRLDHRFTLLTSGRPHGPVHHQTLRRVMEWSYNLCDKPGQLFWERASVFIGGFDLKAAERICPGQEIAQDDILDIITMLVQQSVLMVERGPAGTRYRLLESLRQYGLERLEERGELALVQQRHLDHYHQQTAFAAFDLSHQMNWLEWARRELPNLRTAMEYSKSIAGSTQGLEIATSLSLLRLWLFEGWPAEGRRWLEYLLEQDPDPASPRHLLAIAHAGWHSICQGEPQTAADYLSRYGLTAADTVEATLILAVFSGAYHSVVDRDPRSITYMDRALDKAHAMGAPIALVAALELVWAIASAYLGDREQALRATRQHLSTASQHGAASSVAWAEQLVGIAHLRHGAPRRALSIMRRSLRQQYDIGDRWAILWAAHGVAWSLGADSLADHLTRHADSTVAADVARLLGGLDRLRAWSGITLAGIPALHTPTVEVELAVREVLGDRTYRREFESGQFNQLDRPHAEKKIIESLTGDTPHHSPPEAEASPSPPDNRRESLTSREREITALVAQGLTNPEIARELLISARTAQTHVARILRKTGLRNRQEITAWHISRATE